MSSSSNLCSISGKIPAPKEIDTIQSKLGTLIILFRGHGRYEKLVVLLFLTSVKVIGYISTKLARWCCYCTTSFFDPAIRFFKSFLNQIVKDLKEYGIIISLYSQKLNQIASDCIWLLLHMHLHLATFGL